jgi:HemY protein
MIRVLLFLAVIALAALGIDWLIDRPGSITLVWQGWQIETTVAVALFAVLALTAVLLILWWLLTSIFQIPEAIAGVMRGRRRKRGLGAVAHGLVAIGVGDGRAARRSATEARRLIGDEPLTLLLRAQAAQLSGDRAEAESAFRAMLEREETRPLGYRGLFVEARRRGDDDSALQIASSAAAADPKVPWAGPALLDMQASNRDWDGALASVERNVSAKVVDRASGRRQRAVLLTGKAMDIADERPEDARSLLRSAVDLAPDLVPAAALAGRLLAEAGDYRKAAKIVDKAWRLQPHPDLAEVYLHIRPGDAALDRLKRAQGLQARSGGHVEGDLVLARAALDARDFALARRTLQPHAENTPTRRVCLLMAELDEAELNDRGRARAWRTRALAARPDPAWVADGIVTENWQPFSPTSGKLDAFVWTVPQESLTASDHRLIESDILAAEQELVARTDSVEPAEAVAAPAADEPLQPEIVATPQVQADELAAPSSPAEAEVKTPPVVPVQTSPAPAPTAKPSTPGANRPVSKPEIVLPLAHAPDDPGPDDDGPVDVTRSPERATV